MFLIGTEDIRLGQRTPHLDGVLNHLFLFRDDLGPSGHAPQMMARVTVIALNGHRVGFAYNMTFFGKHVRKGLPVIRIEDALFQVFDFIVEPLEGCSITTANNPGHGSL